MSIFASYLKFEFSFKFMISLSKLRCSAQKSIFASYLKYEFSFKLRISLSKLRRSAQNLQAETRQNKNIENEFENRDCVL